MSKTMKRLVILAAVSMISACATQPIDTNIPQLSDARAMIAKAKAAGAEQCAPERQAEAVVDLYAAAHEYSEYGVHPQEDADLAASSLKAATQAYEKSKHGCKPEVIELKGVHFKTNSADLTPASTAILDHAVAVLTKRSHIKVEVAAYTDSRGSDKYNLGLSDRRAKSVMSYLTAHGIAASRLTSHGYGETHPIGDNKTAAGRAMNRRVELRVLSY